ncbi:cyclic lactone autoinducer peptide [Paenibacillus pabuli]|nr:cyclic lactone autoinducer peptide [Paenibacillus pabuli]UPK45913.1 cyclic lactone autoinducer peptide [Paenibacillus pabuli]
MRVVIYSAIASSLGVIAALTVMPASLIFVNNPKPPKHLLKK